jgi:hypothetical protein
VKLNKHARIILAAALLSMVSWWIARAIGIEPWQDWVMGDRFDIALYVFVSVVLLGWPNSNR